MADKNGLGEKPRCCSVLKDGSACKGAAVSAWGDRCEYHGLIAAGVKHGWRVRGNRRAAVFVADRDKRLLVADTPAELLGLIEAAGC